jgi:hypothetical protein
MIRFASTFVALGLAAAGSTALAAPVPMTDAQLDDVSAGELVIVFQDSLNNLTINFGGGGNGLARGWENGKNNPHKSDGGSSAVSWSKHANTVFFTININVNTATGG